MVDWEGCLSVPGIRGQVARSYWVEVLFQDPLGAPQKQRFQGFLARIFCYARWGLEEYVCDYPFFED